jgi:CheY-like chemotaxis protein
MSGGLTILLVEDDEMNRDMLERRLRRRGLEVLLAVDGEAALRQARLAQPDLILMDISLPVYDGLEVTRRLKADPLTRGIPVIALTAHAFADDRDRALAVGCAAFHTKPVDFPKLLELIETFQRTTQ